MHPILWAPHTSFSSQASIYNNFYMPFFFFFYFSALYLCICYFHFLDYFIFLHLENSYLSHSALLHVTSSEKPFLMAWAVARSSSSFPMWVAEHLAIIFPVVAPSLIRLRVPQEKGDCFVWWCGCLPPQGLPECWTPKRCSGHVCGKKEKMARWISSGQSPHVL